MEYGNTKVIENAKEAAISRFEQQAEEAKAKAAERKAEFEQFKIDHAEEIAAHVAECNAERVIEMDDDDTEAYIEEFYIEKKQKAEFVEQPPRERNIIFFHDDCDGWGACGLALNGLDEPDRDFVTKPVNYSDDFTTVLDTLRETDHVYVLDFSFKRGICDAIHAKVAKFVVLDHHKTAEKELEGAEYATFDMTKSGVRLALDHFFPEYKNAHPSSIPVPVTLLDNYDLWKKKDELVAWEWVVAFHMLVEPMRGDFMYWRELMAMIDLTSEIYAAMENKKEEFKFSIEELTKSAEFEEIVFKDGTKGLVYPASEMISLLADHLKDHHPSKPDFTTSYFIKEDEVIVSLRGTEKYKVRELAERNNGGGHDLASGFFFKFDGDRPLGVQVIQSLVNKQ